MRDLSVIYRRLGALSVRRPFGEGRGARVRGLRSCRKKIETRRKLLFANAPTLSHQIGFGCGFFVAPPIYLDSRIVTGGFPVANGIRCARPLRTTQKYGLDWLLLQLISYV